MKRMKFHQNTRYLHTKKVNVISLSENAQKQVLKAIQSRGKGLGIRVGVRTSGCSGMAYTMEYLDERHPEDIVVEYDDVILSTDPKSLVYIDGTVIEFEKEGLNEGFVFKNPNVTAECGCGESFNV